MPRVDAVVSATFLVTLAAPVVVLASLRLVRRGNHDAHRLTQAVLLVVCWIAVLALELRIRFAGGSGSLVAGAPEALRPWAAGLLWIHISGAVITFGAWTWLAISSWRRYGNQLPGSFSRAHRLTGKLIFAGLCFTAASATVIYLLVFIA